MIPADPRVRSRERVSDLQAVSVQGHGEYALGLSLANERLVFNVLFKNPHDDSACSLEFVHRDGLSSHA